MQKIKPEFRPNLKTQNFFDETIRTIIFVVVVTVLFDMAIPRSLVDGRSMFPTYEDRERLIVSRAHYLVTDIRRGDVIVFNSVERPDDEMLIKRVVGLPGDTLEFRSSELYINGQLVPEPYIKECLSRCSDRTWEVPEDSYFVMGDNRDGSRDSRVFGTVPISNVVGRVIFRYWPLSRIGLAGHYEHDF